MNADLVPFDNGEFHLDLQPHSVDGFRVSAEQLARALSTRGRDLVRSIPDVEKGRALVRTPGGEQESWYLTEAGFYRAIGQRQTGRIEDPDVRAQVERFQGWVFGTVLPSIRRGTQSAAALPDRKALAQMVIEAEEAREIAEARAHELEAKVEADAPKVEAYEQFMEADGTYLVGTVARMLGTSQNKLFEALRERGVFISKGAMRNTPYQRFMQHFTVKATHFERSDGSEGVSYTTRVKPSGVDFIRRRLNMQVVAS